MAPALVIAALIAATAPSPYALFRDGRPMALGPVHRPSGLLRLERDQRALLRATPRDLAAFKRWAQDEGVTAVLAANDDGDQPLPVVLAKGPARALTRYGRVSKTQSPAVYRVQLGPGVVDPEQVAQRIAAEPEVEWAEPDRWIAFATRAVFNDPFYPVQWHLHRDSTASPVKAGIDIHADLAWDISRGDGVRVGVLDDGFSLQHPDLVAQYASGEGGALGYDFADDDADPSPRQGDFHGTRVAGTLAASGDNSIGGVGVCPGCKLIPVRAFTANQTQFDPVQLFGPMSVAADGMRYAADNGARIINNSWGPGLRPNSTTYAAPPQYIRDTIRELVRRGPPGQEGSAGVLIVWAAPNTWRSAAAYDGWMSDPRVLAVGALNASGELANYTSVGPQIRIVAPSDEIDSVLPAIVTTNGSDSYSSTFGGTSAAAPIVAGVAALVLGRHPTLTLAQLFEVLLDSAEKRDPHKAYYGRDGLSCTMGAGKVDALAALRLAEQRAPDYANGRTLRFELCGDGVDNDGDPATSDVCASCVPRARPSDGEAAIDHDCDGFVGNTQPCLPLERQKCEECSDTDVCLNDLRCASRPEGMRCLRACDGGEPCSFDERCADGVCLPVVAGEAAECSTWRGCTVSNGAVEVCDGLDNDCNGNVDDVDEASDAYRLEQARCVRGFTGVCATAKSECVLGQWYCPNDTRTTEVLATIPEVCDGRDNNCNGYVDEGCPADPLPEPPAPPVPAGCANVTPVGLWWVGLLLGLRRLQRRVGSAVRAASSSGGHPPPRP